MVLRNININNNGMDKIIIRRNGSDIFDGTVDDLKKSNILDAFGADDVIHTRAFFDSLIIDLKD